MALPEPRNNDPTPEDWGRIAKGAIATGLLPQLELETEAIVKGIVQRAVAALRSGTLTGDAALSAFHEISMAQRYLRNFQTRARMGQSTAQEFDLTINKEQ